VRLPTELSELSAEQEDIVNLCRKFAAEEIRPVARDVDEGDTQVPWNLWYSASKVGLTSFMLPETFGGGGFTDLFTQCLVQEELCAGDLSIGNVLTANGFFAHPVLELGTDEQQHRMLTPLAGERPPMTSLAVTEPEAGSDAANIRTRAARDGAGYRLNGRKAWTSNAGASEYYIIFATIDPDLRSRGVTAFVVHKDTPGLHVSAPWKKMGQRALLNAEVVLDDVHVGEDEKLGAEGGGFAGLMHTFDCSRTILAAGATGLARAATEYATQYAQDREQFGKPIIKHQAVAFRLADMATKAETARLMTWRAAKRIDAGQPASRESAMAKLVASEAAMFATWAAVQTLGGWGYSREFPVEQWMRDAKLEEIEEGTSDIQRLIISRSLDENA